MMFMLKRMLSVCLCLALMAGLMPAIAVFSGVEEASALSTNLVQVPDNNGVTNNTSYVIGEGTDAETTVYCDWRSTSMAPTGTITPKYIAIHCMGNYAKTADAAANHNYNKSQSAADSYVAWHYTVGEDAIYQGLADTRKGWHVGTSNTGAPSNSNSIGLELVVNNFPATASFSGEQWSDGDAIMAWWESQFDQTMKNAAYLTLVLCERWGLDWQTSIKMHWDSKSYQDSNGTYYGKDCPMQMRATYDPSTNTFKKSSSYSDGRDGYFWQMFMGYVEDYASGVSYTNAEKLGTYRITPSDGLNVREGAGSSYTKVGVLEQNEIVEITALSNGWGQVTLENGTVGWCSIAAYGEYIGVDATAYTQSVASGNVSYARDSDGGLIVTNNSSTAQGQLDLYTPHGIGTYTTPYLSTQVTLLSGDGYYFGLTQSSSGYWMMRDCDSSDQLVNADTASYMTGIEQLEIDISTWWVPTQNYQIDQVRFYLAPSTSIKIDYFYFAAASGVVKSMAYNLLANPTNVSLLQPDTIDTLSYNQTGSYTYSNGRLTVNSESTENFDVILNVNQDFEVATMKRLLIGVEAQIPFNVSLLVTNSQGEGWVSLVSDFYPAFTSSYPEDGYIPAWTGTAGLDLYNYFAYNKVTPEDGMSTIKQVKVSVCGVGTVYLNALQIAENDAIASFMDGVSKSESTADLVLLDSDVFTTADTIVSNVSVGMTAAEFTANVSSSYTVTLYENGVAVEATTAMKTGQIVKVTHGTTELSSYEIAVIGDVDGDGDMNSTDARAILLAAVGTPLTGAKVVAADVLGTGETDSALARNLMMELLG